MNKYLDNWWIYMVHEFRVMTNEFDCTLIFWISSKIMSFLIIMIIIQGYVWRKKVYDFRYQVFVGKNWLFQMIWFFDIYELIRIRSLTRVSLFLFHSVVTSFQMLKTGRRSDKYIIWYHFKKILHILTHERRLTRILYNVINSCHVSW